MSPYNDENRLANATSPYLLQHKDNPVHWREWGQGVLDEARLTGKPILLSIGYAACHWCHVMAHESFENEAIAAIANRLFIPVKVDREERPDVDRVYMAALHALGEQGGWPLTMFLTPDGDAFWGGTYFPPEPRFGRPGFGQVLEAIGAAYREKPDQISRNASAIRAHLEATLTPAEAVADAATDEAILDAAVEKLHRILDPVHGGMGTAPKFPNAPASEALWRHWLRRRDRRSRDAFLTWTRAIALGGIYDHLGGGLARYAVDAEWLVPHFEKMLYDNAQFLRALTWAWRETAEELFRERIEETVAFLLRDFRQPGGAFASSFDADSEGEEGRYYVWTKDEITDVLGEASELFCSVYDVRPEGNWEGRTILNRLRSGNRVLSQAERASLEQSRKSLLAGRTGRIPPALDDKVLADWNGLAIRALAEAGTSLGRPEWIDAAQKAFDFIMNEMVSAKGLHHSARTGRLGPAAFATDYAALAAAAIALHAATGAEDHRERAGALVRELHTRFSDGAGGYFLQSAEAAADTPFRLAAGDDEAIPSADAMILEAFTLVALATGDAAIHDLAVAAAKRGAGRVRAQPYASFGLANALDTLLRQRKVIVTGQSPGFDAVLLRHADPARLDLRLTRPEAEAAIGNLNGKSPPDIGTAQEAATAFVCTQTECLPPVWNPSALEALLTPKPTSRS